MQEVRKLFPKSVKRRLIAISQWQIMMKMPRSAAASLMYAMNNMSIRVSVIVRAIHGIKGHGPVLKEDEYACPF
jgi:hypothetical protein